MRTRRRLRLFLPSAIVLALAFAVTWLAHPRDGTSAASATLAVAPGGSDSGQCTLDAPCATFARAYKVASPGAVVQIQAGSYGPQLLGYDSSKLSGPPVTFAAAPGATVKLDTGLLPGQGGSGLVIAGASNVTFVGIDIVGLLNIVSSTGSATNANTRYPSGITFQGLHLAGYFTIRGANGVTFRDSTIGDYAIKDDNPRIAGVPKVGNYNGQQDATNILFERTTFQNIVRPPGTKTHAECLYLDGGVTGLRIEASKFTNCAVFDIFVYKTNGRAPSNVTIENTWLDAARDSNGAFAGSAIDFKEFPSSLPATANWLIRFNSLRGSLLFKCFAGDGCANAWSNVVVSSNVGTNPSFGTCLPPGAAGVSFDHNVWSGRACSPADRVAPLGFVASNGFDFHLLPGVPAIGAGNPDSHPALDIDGRLRPLRMPPDAGAVQHESAAIVLGQSIGSAAIGMTREEIRTAYGAPRHTQYAKLTGVPGKVRVDAMAASDGRIRVYYAGEKVIGLGTSSLYYTTVNGLGPGAKLTAAGGLAKGRCTGGYQRRRSGTGTYVLASHATPPAIADLLTLAKGVSLTCKPA